MNNQYRFLLPEIQRIARASGDIIMKFYCADISIISKSDQSPLTDADIAANDYIVKELAKLTPSLPIISEEAPNNCKSESLDGYYWLVDPLDGTKEFIKKNGEFTVNIALVHQGEPEVGVVYAPAMNILYAAGKHLGAFKDNGQGLIAISVSTHKTGSPWMVVASRSHAFDGMECWLNRLDDYELVNVGSSLKICLVAEGTADLYPRFAPTCFWDTAAAHAILNEAGGNLVAANGKAVTYPNKNNFLNPSFLAFGKSQLPKDFFDF